MVDFAKLELSPPPQITFVDPNTREPAVGTIYFFKATDHDTPKLVYRDSGDPDNPFTAITQVTLDAAGAWPYPIYLYPYDDTGNQELYYVQGLRADSDCNNPSEFFAVDNWPNKYPASGGGGGSETNDVYNFITDGIFSFPFNFNIPGDTPGQILNNNTQIAQSWYFETDTVGKTPAQNNVFVTFEPLYLDGLAGNPVNACRVKVTNFVGQMNKLDVYQDLGPINLLQNESITLLIQGLDNLGAGSTTVITPILEFKYSGTKTTTQELDAITLTGTEATHSITAAIQELDNSAIDPDDNYLRIRFRFPLLAIVDAQITTLQIERGLIVDPKYIEVPSDLTKARTIANDWVEPQKTTDQKDLANYEPLYFKDGKYAFMGYAGQIFVPVFKTSCPPNLEICTGQFHSPTDYSTANIPYKKVYDVWGTTFGGGNGIIATAAANAVTATSGLGGRQLLPWTSTTSPNANLTIVLTQRGQNCGVSAVLKSGTTNTVTLTWLDKFVAVAPPWYPSEPNLNDVANQGAGLVEVAPYANLGNHFETYLDNGGARPIPPQAPGLATVVDVTVGSTSDFAVSEITFNEGGSNKYLPTAPSAILSNPSEDLQYQVQASLGFFEWATIDSNTRARPTPNPFDWSRTEVKPGVVVGFSVDKVTGPLYTGNLTTVTVAILSTDSAEQVTQKFIAAVNNPFVYTITVNAVPVAGSKIQCYTTTDGFYRWFKVDGVGSDPGGTGTGAEIDISSSDTLPEIATKIANSINIQSFNFPEQADFPSLPNSDFEWAAFIA